MFNKVLRPVLSWTRALSIRILAYLGDILIIGESKENQVGEIFDFAIIVDNPSCYNYRFPGHEPQSPFNQDSGPPQRSDQTVDTWQDDVEMPGELYWESSSHVSFPPTGSTHAETTFGAQ
ncbi:hypothetical protein AYI68_g2206 [Smittium mucronatum]|uniref:Uncharacterized protein n=1 Tax=Smittium mucronatum TaxID=133383 RepID=A0A1R0H3E6_9FUNG|nr:hypothetical protein AYI68_g2206 [Smittium mucronatum]